MKFVLLLLFLSVSPSLSFKPYYDLSEKFQDQPLALVDVYAENFILGIGVDDATITTLENPSISMTTGDDGTLSFNWPIGENVTLIFSKWDYMTTQIGTVTVPEQGLEGIQQELTVQAPDPLTYELLLAIIPGSLDSCCCAVVTTISAANKTLYDDPQGEANSTAILTPSPPGQTPFYFGILLGKTNPFQQGLNVTSEDGGVVFMNVPVGDYMLGAQKAGVVFDDPAYSVIKCRGGASLINASPPWGPRVSPSGRN